MVLINSNAKACVSHSKICANLDASKIMTRSLGEFKKEQRKKVLKIEDRKEVCVLNKKEFPNCSCGLHVFHTVSLQAMT